MIGLMVLMKYGHYLLLAMEPVQAEEIIRNYASRAYALRGQRCLEGVSFAGGGTSTTVRWVIDLEEVVAMHTQPLNQPAAPPGRGPATPFPGARSGN